VDTISLGDELMKLVVELSLRAQRTGFAPAESIPTECSGSCAASKQFDIALE
jgi:hypothetical protein